MHVALRRRLRLPLPLTGRRCGAQGRHGCGAEVDAYGDHCHACPRTGLLPRRGFVVERAWVQVAREAVGPEGRVVPQQWLAHTTAPQVRTDDRRRLDFVVYGAMSTGEALCCDATLVSPPALASRPARPTPLRASAAQGWARRWWSVLSVALQRAVACSALGVWSMPPLPGADDALPLGDVLDLASASAPSRLPLR